MTKINHSWEYSQKPAKSRYFLPSHIFTFHSLVTIANGQIEWSQSINFNRIQDGAWFNSSCVYNLKFRKLSNLGLVEFSVMFYNMS